MAHLTREEVLQSGQVAPEYQKVRSPSSFTHALAPTSMLND
jgi:hypothetical protein